MAEKNIGTAKLFPILLVTFINMLGMSVVLPFLVVIVLKMGGNALTYGLMGATYSVFQLIGGPLLGSWSDQAGRKKILLICEIGTFVGWMVFIIGLLVPVDPLVNGVQHNGLFFSLPLILIFIARALDGLTGGSISVANAYLSDISTKAERKSNFGKISASSNMGLIFGPLLAGLLGATKLGNLLPVIATALISFVAIFVVYFFVHESHHRKESVDDKVVPGGSNGNLQKLGLFKVFKIAKVPYFLVLYFLIFLAFNFFYIGFPVYAAGELHWSVLQLGIFFSFISGALVLVQGPLLSVLSKRFSGASLVICGSLMLAVCFACLTFNNLVVMYIGAFFFALGNGLMWPSFVALLSNTGDGDTQGAIQGIASSAGSLASIVGLISGAFLFEVLHGNLFFVTAGFMAVIGLLAIPLIKIEKTMA